MTGITPAELVKAVRNWIKAWPAPPQKLSSVDLAKDPLHPLEILSTSPRGLRVIVSYSGGPTNGAEENPNAAIVTHGLTIWIGYSLGLTADINKKIADGNTDRPALLEIISLVDQRVRALIMPDEVSSRYFRLAGIDDVVLPDGIPLAAQKLRYAIEALMPDPEAHFEATLDDDTNAIVLPDESTPGETP